MKRRWSLNLKLELVYLAPGTILPSLYSSGRIHLWTPYNFCLRVVRTRLYDALVVNLGAGRTWHGSTGYFYLPYVERFPMVYPLYSFRDTIGKVHTDPLGALRPPSCTGKFKMLQFSCNTCHIVPLIIRSKKVNHMISVRCCVFEIKDKIRKGHWPFVQGSNFQDGPILMKIGSN